MLYNIHICSHVLIGHGSVVLQYCYFYNSPSLPSGSEVSAYIFLLFKAWVLKPFGAKDTLQTGPPITAKW